jgi:hypothetical protein
MVMLTTSVPIPPMPSVELAVIWCTPLGSAEVTSVAPIPSRPLWSELQWMLALRSPSSWSIAVAEKATAVLTGKTAPSAGAPMLTTGMKFTGPASIHDPLPVSVKLPPVR